MSQAELVTVLRAQPFRPFRLRLPEGITYDIRHSDTVLATPSTIHVGLTSSTAANALVQEVVIVSMRHIVQLEFLGPAPSQTNPDPTNN